LILDIDGEVCQNEYGRILSVMADRETCANPSKPVLNDDDSKKIVQAKMPALEIKNVKDNPLLARN
jgi:hypothetical protein